MHGQPPSDLPKTRHHTRNVPKQTNNSRRHRQGCRTPPTGHYHELGAELTSAQVGALNMHKRARSLARTVTYRELLMSTHCTPTCPRKFMYNLIKSITMEEPFVSHWDGMEFPTQSTIPRFIIHSQHSKVLKIDIYVLHI